MSSIPKLTFKYDFGKDARSWVRWVFYGNPHLSETRSRQHKEPLLAMLGNTQSENQAQEISENYLVQSKTKVNSLVKHFQAQIEPAWREIESSIFRKIELVTKRPIYSKFFTGYLVTSGHCSYFPPEHWFMVNLKDQKPITDIIHELFHLQFLTYYEKFCLEQGLNHQEIYTLSEALTVILNVEMKEYLDKPDKGYEKHSKLREEIAGFWHKGKDLEKLLNKLIDRLKTMPGL